MQVQVRIPIAALLVVLVLATTATRSLSQDYEGAPNCFGTPGTVNHGPNIRPSLPATISLGVILVEFTDRLHYTRQPDRPNGYLKQDFENMLFTDDFYLDPLLHPENEAVFGSLKDYYQENSHGLVQITGQVINPADGNGVLTWLNLGSTSNYHDNERKMIVDAINQAATVKNWNCNYNVIAVASSRNEEDTILLRLGRGRAYHGSSNFGGASAYRILASELPQGSPNFTYNNFMGAYSTSNAAN